MITFLNDLQGHDVWFAGEGLASLEQPVTRA